MNKSLSLSLFVAALGLGCSGESFSVAKHTALPRIDDNGGGILSAPELVTVTFDPSLYANVGAGAAALVSDLQDFDDTITSTAWWSTVTKDYCDPRAGCVGTAGAHVAIAALPPGDATSAGACGSAERRGAACYSDTAVGSAATLKTYISDLLQAGTLPPAGPQTLYVFYLPSQVTIDVDGAITCHDIGGYHDSLSVNGQDVPYAIVPVCDPEPTSAGTPPLTIEQTATLAASHEIVEAVTDPHGGQPSADGNPNSTKNLGWYLTDTASQAWAVLAGGEVGDLCVDLLGLGQDRWTEGGHVFQRIWSNSSAAASHDPCVPIPRGEVYFNAAPSPAASEQLKMAVGDTANVSVQAFSDAARGSWQVFGCDVSSSGCTGAGSVLDIAPAPNGTPASNGSTVPFRITLNQSPSQQIMSTMGTVHIEPYLILSRSLNTFHFWPALVYSGP